MTPRHTLTASGDDAQQPEVISARRRSQILDAAQTLFARRGFAGTSMADIVEASGVATGTVYRYFDNKDALVMAVSEAVIGTDFGVDRDAPPALGQVMDILMSAAANTSLGELSAQVWAQAVGSARLRGLIAQRHERVCWWLARAIDGCAETEPSTHARQSAETIVCAISGLQERLTTGVAIDINAFRLNLQALLLPDRNHYTANSPETTPTP